MKRTIIIAVLLLTFGFTAQAQMVGATNNQQTPRVQRSDNSPLYHPTGGAIRFEGGFPHFFSIAYVYHINPQIMFGAGTGIGLCGETYTTRYYYKPSNSYTYSFDHKHIYRGTEGPTIPLFVEVELHTPKYKWSLFLNVKAGYNLFRPTDYSSIDHRDNLYRYPDYAYDEYWTYDRFFFDASIGVSYKDLSLGGGYSTVCYWNAFISYNIPISTISKWFF